MKGIIVFILLTGANPHIEYKSAVLWLAQCSVWWFVDLHTCVAQRISATWNHELHQPDRRTGSQVQSLVWRNNELYNKILIRNFLFL